MQEMYRNFVDGEQDWDLDKVSLKTYIYICSQSFKLSSCCCSQPDAPKIIIVIPYFCNKVVHISNFIYSVQSPASQAWIIASWVYWLKNLNPKTIYYSILQ